MFVCCLNSVPTIVRSNEEVHERGYLVHRFNATKRFRRGEGGKAYRVIVVIAVGLAMMLFITLSWPQLLSTFAGLPLPPCHTPTNPGRHSSSFQIPLFVRLFLSVNVQRPSVYIRCWLDLRIPLGYSL